MVNLDIKDESPPTSNYDLTDLMSKHHLTQSSVSDNSTVNANVSSQLTLSPLKIDKADANQQSVTNTDVSLSGLLNGCGAQVVRREHKEKDFTNSLCKSDLVPMKFKDDSACEGSGSLSNILSGISVEDYDAPIKKSLSRAISPAFNVTLNDISVPEFCETAKKSNSSAVHDSSLKNTNLLNESSFNVDYNFSDILSSIRIDSQDAYASDSTPKSSSLCSNERNACMADSSINWEICDTQLSDFDTASNSFSACGNAISPNSFSLSNGVNEDSSKLSIAELGKSHILSSVDSEILNSKEKQCGNYSKKGDKNIEQVNFSFFDFPSEDVSPRSQNGCENEHDNLCTVINNSGFSKSKLDVNEDLEFEFFPEQSLYNINRKTDNIKNTPTINLKDSNEEDTISMLDLFNSVNNGLSSTKVSKSDEDNIGLLELINPVNTPTHNTSTSQLSNVEENVNMFNLFNLVNNSSCSTSVSESSSCMSDEIEKNKNSSSDYFTLDEDDDDKNIWNIDLSTCIKTQDNTSGSNALDIPKKNSLHYTTSEIPIHKPVKNLENDFKYSLPFTNFTIPENSHVNVKRSLFAKSMACKPKKNHTLMQKVAKIKCELFDNVFNRPAPLKKSGDIPKATLMYSDECMISCTGRRIFAPSASCELQ